VQPLVDGCIAADIRDPNFSVPSEKIQFYERLGFQIRSDEARDAVRQGMNWIVTSDAGCL
jgi:hypothetical protein